MELKEGKIIEIVDLFEQVFSVNNTIDCYKKSDSQFMLKQYQYRKNGFLQSLNHMLKGFNISPAGLVI